jgi:hypothetical protein
MNHSAAPPASPEGDEVLLRALEIHRRLMKEQQMDHFNLHDELEEDERPPG